MRWFKRKPIVEVRLTRDPVKDVDRSTVDRQVEKMRETNEKLRQLLVRPEPGLMTWYQSVGQCLRVFKDIHDGTWDGN